MNNTFNIRKVTADFNCNYFSQNNAGNPDHGSKEEEKELKISPTFPVESSE